MEPVALDRIWWDSLSPDEQRQIIEIVHDQYYIAYDRVKRLHESLSRGYSDLHH